MDLHKYPIDTQHCPLMIGSCELRVSQTNIRSLLTRRIGHSIYET